MVNKDKIPGPIYEQLLELYGEEKTEQIVKRNGYNHHFLVFRIADEKLRRKLGIKLSPLLIFVFILLFLVWFINNQF